MANYRVLYTSLVTGTVLGELPVSSVSYSHVLNSPGSFSAVLALDPDNPETQVMAQPVTSESVTLVEIEPPSPVAVGSLIPAGTGVYIERDNVILWGGILWTSVANVEANTLTIAGEGFMSYFRRRHITADVTFSATFQENIAKSLIDTAQLAAGGDLGVVTTSVASGKARDRTYLGIERKSVGEAIEQLAAVNDGFDFYFDSSWVSNTIQTSLVTRYPTGGATTDYVFELGTNAALMNVTEDGTTVTSVSEAIGAEYGDEAVFSQKTDPALHSTYPRLEVVESYSDVRRTSTLDDHAQRRLDRGSEPMRRVQALVYADSLPKLGSYLVGDVVEVKGTYGLLDLSGMFRIVELGVSVQPTGVETVVLNLVPQGVF